MDSWTEPVSGIARKGSGGDVEYGPVEIGGKNISARTAAS